MAYGILGLFTFCSLFALLWNQHEGLLIVNKYCVASKSL